MIIRKSLPPVKPFLQVGRKSPLTRMGSQFPLGIRASPKPVPKRSKTFLQPQPTHLLTALHRPDGGGGQSPASSRTAPRRHVSDSAPAEIAVRTARCDSRADATEAPCLPCFLPGFLTRPGAQRTSSLTALWTPSHGP